jgi:hypothetical protein
MERLNDAEGFLCEVAEGDSLSFSWFSGSGITVSAIPGNAPSFWSSITQTLFFIAASFPPVSNLMPRSKAPGENQRAF